MQQAASSFGLFSSALTLPDLCTGCMLVELQTGQPLFPGASDVDQLWKILQCLCSPSFGCAACVARHPTFAVRLPSVCAATRACKVLALRASSTF